MAKKRKGRGATPRKAVRAGIRAERGALGKVSRDVRGIVRKGARMLGF